MIEVALASREVHPFAGGGIGTYVNALARVLEPVARVTVVTSASHEREYRRLAAAGDERIPPGARFVFARDPAPGDELGFDSWHHVWSTRLYEAIAGAFPGGGPDLVEFHDYLGEGAVTAQAAHARDPALRNTRVCVRISSTAELCSVLDGHLGHDFGVPRLADLERISLRYADAVLWGGGDVLGTYRGYYGAGALAPAHRVRHALWAEGHERGVVTPAPKEDGRLRMLYVGRLERRKGVQNLLRAVTAIGDPRWHLTLVGGDTDTAPLRSSMRAQLEAMAAGDPRISFLPPQPRGALRDIVLRHHLLVVPSLWECWPGVGLEALALNRPLVGTPTGGLAEMVRDGLSGWLTRDTDADSLHETLTELVANRNRVNDLIASGGPRRHGLALTNPEEIRRDYARLAAAPSRHGPAARAGTPLVSVVIPYYRLHRYVERAVAAAFAQTHRPLEVIVVNDGSFEHDDGVLASLAARYPIHVLSQPNGGLGRARNAGIAVSRGRYVFPLDADNEPELDFVARCVAVLEADPAVAYATSWSRYVDDDGVELPPPADGYRPLGNLAELRERNAAGDAAAVLRRSLFLRGFAYSEDVHAVEDWLLYRELREAGLHGAVIPARLVRYRVRGDSMYRELGLPHRERIAEEMEAHAREGRVRWLSSSV
ncbi:MAG: glycosyltransferase [Thermoleophilaceae bacterium]